MFQNYQKLKTYTRVPLIITKENFVVKAQDTFDDRLKKKKDDQQKTFGELS